jgi:glycosyltransferase involved in cell wall biosynthesis
MDAWSRLFLGRPRLGSAVRRLTGVPTTLVDLGRHAIFLYISDMIRRRVESASPWRPAVASVVYAGIDPVDFPPTPATERPWRWRLLHVGRIDDRKGIHTAVESMSRLPPEATLEIVGRGEADYLSLLREQAVRLGVDGRVRFGVTERETLRKHYLEADVLLFPTIWEEPFGLVPIEAMACGTPVVATGTGGSGEFLVDGVNCLRIPPNDPRALAAAVERLAFDPALRARLCESGLRTAADLTIDRWTDVLEAWHVAAAQDFRSGRPPERRLSIA